LISVLMGRMRSRTRIHLIKGCYMNSNHLPKIFVSVTFVLLTIISSFPAMAIEYDPLMAEVVQLPEFLEISN
jgi:hypothetical protein